MVGVLDVFVPVVDREVVYDWVLFTRTEQVEPAQATPVVPAEESVMVKADIDESVRELGTLTYPERAWQVPDDDGSVIAQVRDLIATRAVRTVQADVDSDERRPLGYLRATLLAATFVDDRPTELPPVETTVTADRPEAITIVFGDAAPNVAERNSGRSTATATSKASATRPAAKSAPTAAKAPTRSRRSAAKSAAGKSAGAAAKRGSTSKSASPKTERR